MSIKRVSHLSGDSSSSSRSYSSDHLNRVLIENFIALQKVIIKNSERVDLLSGQISKLLEIFEISAKSFAEKNFKPVSANPADLQKEAEFLSKLNTLLDQNKTIAKGLSLLGDDLKEKLYGDSSPSTNQNINVPTSSLRPQTPQSIPNFSRNRLERVELQMPRFQPLSEKDNNLDSSDINRKLPKI